MGAANNGGPAFPQVELDRISGQIIDQHFGVSLRDYFAGKALQGMLAAMKLPTGFVAAEAYQFADAMLAERAK